jgi:hypothetical protein
LGLLGKTARVWTSVMKDRYILFMYIVMNTAKSISVFVSGSQRCIVVLRFLWLKFSVQLWLPGIICTIC